MILRTYQSRAVDRAIAALDAGERPIILAPTGSGKTTIGVEIACRLSARDGGSPLWVAHRQELLDQARERLDAVGSAIPVISIQTIARRGIHVTPSLVVIDECHHATSKSYLSLLSLPAIGLTATPCRLDGRGLRNAGFTQIIEAATVKELITDGFLVNPTYYSLPAPDLTGVAIEKGDYASAGLRIAMRTPKITGDVLAHYKRHDLASKRTLVYACDLDDAQFLADLLHGVVVSGDTPDAERRDILKRIRSGPTTVVNCQLWTEGVDIHELEAVVLRRPTKSLALYFQMVGRVLRPAPQKSALVIDHAGNYREHGPVTDPIAFSLDDRPKRPRLPSTRTCPECYAIHPAPARSCPKCGHVYDFTISDRLTNDETDLTKIIPYEDRRAFWYAQPHPAAYAAQFGAAPRLVLAGTAIVDEHGSNNYRRDLFKTLCRFYRESIPTKGHAVEDYFNAYGKLPQAHVQAVYAMSRRHATV